MKSTKIMAYDILPDKILMNGKGPYMDNLTKTHECFTVTQGKESHIYVFEQLSVCVFIFYQLNLWIFTKFVYVESSRTCT